MTKNSGQPFAIIKCPHFRSTLGLLFPFDMTSPLKILAKEKSLHKLQSLYFCLLPQIPYADFGNAATKNDLALLNNHESLKKKCDKFTFVNDKTVNHFLIQYLFCFNALGYTLHIPLLCSFFISIVGYSVDKKRLFQNLQTLDVFSNANLQLQRIEEWAHDPSKKLEMTVEWCSLLFASSLPVLHSLALNLWKKIVSQKNSEELSLIETLNIGEEIEDSTPGATSMLILSDQEQEVHYEKNSYAKLSLGVLEWLSRHNPVLASRFFLLLSQNELLSKSQQVVFCLKIFTTCHNRIELVTFLNAALTKIFSYKKKIDQKSVSEDEIFSLLCFLEKIGDTHLGIELILWFYPIIEEKERFLNALNRLFSVISQKDPLTFLKFFSSAVLFSIKSEQLKKTALNLLETSVNQQSIPGLSLIPLLSYLTSFELTVNESLRCTQIRNVLMNPGKDQTPVSLEEIAAFPKEMQITLSIKLIEHKLGQWNNVAVGQEIISLCSNNSLDKVEKEKLQGLLGSFVKHLINPFDKYLLSFAKNVCILAFIVEKESTLLDLLAALKSHCCIYSSEIAQLQLSIYNHIYQTATSLQSKSVHKALSEAMFASTATLNQLQKNEKYHGTFLESLYACSLHKEVCQWVISKRLKLPTKGILDLACASVLATAKTLNSDSIAITEQAMTILSTHMTQDCWLKIHEEWVLFYIQQKNNKKCEAYICDMVAKDPKLLSNPNSLALNAYYDQIASPTLKINWLYSLFNLNILSAHWAEKVVELTQSKKQDIYLQITCLSLPQWSVNKIKQNLEKTLRALCHHNASIGIENSLTLMDIAVHYQVRVEMWRLLLKNISLDSPSLIKKVVDVLHSFEKSFSESEKSLYQSRVVQALLKLNSSDWICLHQLVPSYDQFLYGIKDENILNTVLLNMSLVLNLTFEEKETFLQKMYALRLHYHSKWPGSSFDIRVDKALVQACSQNGSSASMEWCLSILQYYLKDKNSTLEVSSIILNSLSPLARNKEDQFIPEFIKIVEPLYTLFQLSDIYQLMEWSTRLPKEDAICSLSTLLPLAYEKNHIDEAQFSSWGRLTLKNVLEFLINTGEKTALKQVQQFFDFPGINKIFSLKDFFTLKQSF